MDPTSYYFAIHSHERMERRFRSPEWRHRVELEAARRAWRSARGTWWDRMSARAWRLRQRPQQAPARAATQAGC